MIFNDNGEWRLFRYEITYTERVYGDYTDGFPENSTVHEIVLTEEQQARLDEIQGVTMPEYDAVAYVRDGVGTVPDNRDDVDKLIDKLLELDPEGTATSELIIEAAHEWRPGASYDRYVYVEHESVLYKTIHPIRPHETLSPVEAPHLYARIGAISGGEIIIEEWRQPTGEHDAYKIGDKVLHKGQTWVCTLGDGAGLNSWEPGVYGWEVVV